MRSAPPGGRPRLSEMGRKPLETGESQSSGLLGRAQNLLWMYSQLGAKSGSDCASCLLCLGCVHPGSPQPTPRAAIQGLPSGWLGAKGTREVPRTCLHPLPLLWLQLCHQASGSLCQPPLLSYAL